MTGTVNIAGGYVVFDGTPEEVSEAVHYFIGMLDGPQSEEEGPSEAGWTSSTTDKKTNYGN